jgi:hypothetical protein
MNKPELEIKQRYRYMGCRNWLLKTGKITQAEERDFWLALVDFYGITNGCEIDLEEPYEEWTPDVQKVFAIFIAEFPESTTFFVSW